MDIVGLDMLRFESDAECSCLLAITKPGLVKGDPRSFAVQLGLLVLSKPPPPGSPIADGEDPASACFDRQKHGQGRCETSRTPRGFRNHR